LFSSALYVALHAVAGIQRVREKVKNRVDCERISEKANWNRVPGFKNYCLLVFK
jgi:hypothetical protein